jgi:hypothetical protein
LVRSVFGPRQRSPSFFRSQAPHCNSCNHELVEGPRRGREKSRIEVTEHTLCLIEVPDQKEAPDLKIASESGVQLVPVRFQGRPRSVERFRRPT